MRFRVIAMLAVVTLTSCSYRLEKGPQESAGKVPAYSRGQLSYALVSRFVFGPKCVQCHGQAGGISLESYTEVKRNLGGVEAAALLGRSMPKAPVAALTPEEAALLRSWIEAGAPEFPLGNAADPGPEPPLSPTFASIHDRIFAKKCLHCHRAGGSAEDVPLDTAADLLNAPGNLVIPGDPDNSYLAIVLAPGARRPMPPPSSGLSVTAEEVNAIKEWIKNGAKD